MAGDRQTDRQAGRQTTIDIKSMQIVKSSRINLLVVATTIATKAGCNTTLSYKNNK